MTDEKVHDPKAGAPLSPRAKEHTAAWFTGAGLGMFIHYDHASQQGLEASWPLVGGVSGLGYFLAVATRIPREEAMLTERLGDSYRAYARLTGCVVPRLWPASAATDVVK